uniref:Uncharacterized protein n=1 Tax=Romanomermis culicivorax TaxID=13658 RepID=A0A915JF60_ROMCU
MIEIDRGRDKKRFKTLLRRTFSKTTFLRPKYVFLRRCWPFLKSKVALIDHSLRSLHQEKATHPHPSIM